MVVGVFEWLRTNWFQALQSLSIAGGLFFAALAIRRDGKIRRVTNYLTLVKEHRELWLEIYRCPELHRIVDADADLIAQPISVGEDRLVNLLLVHLNTYWELNRQRSILMPRTMADDTRAFLSLPIPRSVWRRTREYRDPAFVAFVEKALLGKGRQNARKATTIS